jgi:hypothetical protein
LDDWNKKTLMMKEDMAVRVIGTGVKVVQKRGEGTGAGGVPERPVLEV